MQKLKPGQKRISVPSLVYGFHAVDLGIKNGAANTIISVLIQKKVFDKASTKLRINVSPAEAFLSTTSVYKIEAETDHNLRPLVCLRLRSGCVPNVAANCTTGRPRARPNRREVKVARPCCKMASPMHAK
ncbi:hypothetical protein EGR_05360 [Echinococcus granulosus]|uniref:Uncharacterized protein n=1 Tax=Echinococcus granulosus TaxID=6210 RepID=W6UE91_ECHGR|nr:hypothetical protein EGR_05360 [Echinococcus granulosus]EUB59740.1 hypothetical protein EGR_05360 [Echinococcus granulosus]